MPSDVPALPARRALAPRYWAGHLLVLTAVVVCGLLGRWQLDVWQDHRTDSATAVTREAPVPLDEVLGPDTAFPASGVGRPVLVEGRWDPARTVYVADRARDGRDGVWVVTPVVMASGSAIPVLRGWTQAPQDAPAAPAGTAALVGLLQPSEDTGAPDRDARDDVIPELSTTDLLPRASYDLYSGYVVATDRDLPSRTTSSTGMSGLAAVTPAHLPGPDSSSGLRNLLYALQWWVFGAFALFMWWRWVEEEILGRRSSPRPR
ncbi:MAG TPA: SURF1 family protein [Actinoplanes sp.]|nr:SURF1 family protein [Actinoplanes sp.]